MNLAKEITAFINAIRELSGVGICYYDLNAFFHYDQYGVKNNRGHYCAFCRHARALPNGREACEKSDKSEALALAKQYKEPFFYQCHMGMRELVIPLLRQNVLLGIVFVGQCRTDSGSGAEIRAKAARMGGDPDEFVSLYRQLPHIAQKDMLNIGTLLSQYFDTKILNNELLSPGAASAASGRDLAAAIRSFIECNYRSVLCTKSIAEEFHVNASYASRCFRQKYQTTITDFICHVRTERAKTLLRTTDAPIGNIALNVGFDDVNYFSRVFRKAVGCPPSSFRKAD